MYQALYRKYRPQVFDDVVGQSHITDTLKAQLQGEKMSHAYLFTGTRGTGKTTCAKSWQKPSIAPIFTMATLVTAVPPAAALIVAVA